MTAAALMVAALAVLLAAWLRGAGTAMTRVPRADALRDASEGQRGAGIVAELLEDREVITPAVGVVASALLVMSAVLGATALGGAGGPARVVAAVLVGLVVFLAGDLIPRQLGRRAPRRLAYVSAPLLAAAVRLGGWAYDLIPEMDDSEAGGVEEEQDEADEAERELIDSVLEFGETIVREVMTPRPDMVTIDVSGSIEELIAVTSDEGFSRIPVTSNGDVVGLVIVKDLLPMLAGGRRPDSVAEVMRPVDFVPETRLASSLLAEMQSSRIHQMIVVDEYGDVVGLVTIEDLLEELVGEITDETDDEEEIFVTPNGEGWDVDARIAVDDLAEEVGVDLPETDGDTVGGLVLDLAGRVPEEGESFEYGPLSITVTRMQGRRVAEVAVMVSSDAEVQ